MTLNEKTAGALCSCLLAIDQIDPDEPVVIANFDQIFEIDLAQVIARFEAQEADAGVITFDSIHPRWSYVSVDEQGRCRQFCEKTVVSRHAIAGFYYFRRGADFVEAAKWSIRRGDDLNGDFFIAPILNYFVLNARKLATAAVRTGAYHSFYTPQKIEAFERAQMIKPTSATLPPVNLVVPAAGQGSRFAKQGYAKPKPFIEVQDRPMIELVLDNLDLPDAREILLLRREHLEAEAEVVQRLDERGCAIVPVEGLTEGTLCTVLLSRQLIDEDRPLLIANSDQLADFSCEAFVRDCFDRGLDGSILVFRDPAMDPKWSFARLNSDGTVAEVAEKQPISDLATVGIYLFRRGSDFVRAAIDMMAKGERVNGEFYTCPVYNYAIRNGLKIGVYEIPMAAMHGLGTPEDLEAYLAAQDKGKGEGERAA